MYSSMIVHARSYLGYNADEHVTRSAALARLRSVHERGVRSSVCLSVTH